MNWEGNKLSKKKSANDKRLSDTYMQFIALIIRQSILEYKYALKQLQIWHVIKLLWPRARKKKTLSKA